MEVRCSSCETEYEFDDALVSARGTSVKCTNCGHQFRVMPKDAGSSGVEAWLVRHPDGSQTEFRSLRELQQGIVQGKLAPHDELTHGSGPPRPLKDIYELQTFFATAHTRASSPTAGRTLLGGAVATKQVSSPTAAPPRPSSVPPPRRRPTREDVTPLGGVPAIKRPTPPPAAASSPSLPAASGPAGHTTSDSTSRSLPPPRKPERNSTASQLPPGAVPGSAAPSRAASVSGAPSRAVPGSAPALPAPSAPSGSLPPAAVASAVSASATQPPPAPAPAAPAQLAATSAATGAPPTGAAPSDLPWQNLQGLRAHESDPSELAPGSGSGTRWILALVVLGGLALVAGTVGKDYFEQFTRSEQPPAKELDPRVPQLLAEAQAALTKNDYEAARGAIAKASVLAESEPQVLATLAQLELSHAEEHWLELQVLQALPEPPAPKRLRSARARAEAKQEWEEAKKQREVREQAAKKGFETRLAAARKALSGVPQQGASAAGGASGQGPASLTLTRARVDLARLSGDLKQARQLAPALSSQATDALNAYTLGALDLAAGESGLSDAIGRLKEAARAESSLGRARALLVFALARSGEVEEAKDELGTLALIAPRYGLIEPLRQYVESLPEQTVVAKKAPVAAPKPRRSRSQPKPKPARSSRPSAAEQVSEAAELHRQGKLSEAESLYQKVLDRDSSNIGALVGLGDIARQRRANATATAYYDRVLAQDPKHLAALMARADMSWYAGNRREAVAFYRRALGHVGTSHPFGARALRRIELYETAAAEPASEAVEGQGESQQEGNSEDTANESEPATDPNEAEPEEQATPRESAPDEQEPPAADEPSNESHNDSDPVQGQDESDDPSAEEDPSAEDDPSADEGASPRERSTSGEESQPKTKRDDSSRDEAQEEEPRRPSLSAPFGLH